VSGIFIKGAGYWRRFWGLKLTELLRASPGSG